MHLDKFMALGALATFLEPGTMILLGSGPLGAVAMVRRKLDL